MRLNWPLLALKTKGDQGKWATSGNQKEQGNGCSPRSSRKPWQQFDFSPGRLASDFWPPKSLLCYATTFTVIWHSSNRKLTQYSCIIAYILRAYNLCELQSFFSMGWPWSTAKGVLIRLFLYFCIKSGLTSPIKAFPKLYVSVPLKI